MELRWKATEFLKKEGIIINVNFIKGSHRWKSRLEIEVDNNTFEKVLKKMHIEYKNRFTQKDEIKILELKDFWNLLHPKIVKVSKSRFESEHFADSVEAAFKEINNTVKGIVKQKTCQEHDGSNLMNRAFSLQNPIIVLDDLSTESGKNIQKGYMQIFSGAMTGIRNPKAHDNIIIDSKKAIHFLFLASLLMLKIDERKGRTISKEKNF